MESQRPRASVGLFRKKPYSKYCLRYQIVQSNIRSYPKQMFQDKYMGKLRVKLFQYLVDFDSFNIGYLAVNHAIPREEEVNVIAWR